MAIIISTHDCPFSDFNFETKTPNLSSIPQNNFFVSLRDKASQGYITLIHILVFIPQNSKGPFPCCCQT
ncbi:hypothetical protein SESBI_33014 [Sesbania bispinosa]|nr:hypothetical protein SESBI_33014 [Sesbania bispinosa]